MTGISKLKLIHRNKDVITNSKDMENLHTIKNFPILMNCVNTNIDDDIFTDLIWEINKKSGVIQLKTLIPLEILYKEQHSGTTGKLWLKHHKEFSEFIHKYKPKSVLEIGGGHGILSTNYNQQQYFLYLKNWVFGLLMVLMWSKICIFFVVLPLRHQPLLIHY